MRLVSEDRTRMVDDDPPLGIAAYKIIVAQGNEYIGQHVGIFAKPEDAESWIKDGAPEPTAVFEVS